MSDASWNDGDWRAQLAGRLSTQEDFRRYFNLCEEEEHGLRAGRELLQVGATPYFAGLADRNDPSCPLRRQIVPRAEEIMSHSDGAPDPLSEDAQSPVKGLVHRYGDRVLMLLTTQCAAYCRFCTRARLVGKAEAAITRVDLDVQLDYLRANPGIRDVILSGGDPLLLSDRRLDMILAAVKAIPFVETVRLHTRVPVFLPMRVTDELVDVLRRHRPVWTSIHVNHAKELAMPTRKAVRRLADAGLPLVAQSVLLRGVNDTVEALENLFQALRQLGVRPYHLYHCDSVTGAGRFRTPLDRGAELIDTLRGRMSGLSLPTYVLDREGGRGKVPVLLARADDGNAPIVLRGNER